MKYSIVTTTIHVPVLLEEYVRDVKAHKRDCFFVVVGDKKTPAEAKTYCEELAKKENIEIVFMDVARQEEYLKDFPELGAHIPYNCIMRRNIGILYAYQRGAETIITIDDDNLFFSKDFVGLHTTGGEKEIEVLAANTGWFNVCSFLKEEFGRDFYHRGFAFEQRFKKTQITSKKGKVRVMASVGFWMGDPDIDAITRLYYLGNPINVVSYERNTNFTLGSGTWSPFNSQNTAFAREVIPAYFLSPKVGRYDDIWGSYVLKRIMDHLGHHISFGVPLVNQKRNPHNYWKNLIKEEHLGMVLTSRFVEALESVQLSGKDYQTCYQEIARALPNVLGLNDSQLKKHRRRSTGRFANYSWAFYNKFTSFFTQTPSAGSITNEHYNCFSDYIEGMNVWITTLKRLNKKY